MLCNLWFNPKNSTSMQVEELVVVAEYNTWIEAEMAKSIIASAGIHVEIHNENMATAYPCAVPARLYVNSKDYETAKMLLRLS